MPRRKGPKLLGIAEVAERIGVDQKTLRRWADADKVPHVRLPSGYRRWTEEQVQQILQDLGITSKTTARTSRAVAG